MKDLQFYVKYNERPLPQIKQIRLNGQTICTATLLKTTTTTPLIQRNSVPLGSAGSAGGGVGGGRSTISDDESLERITRQWETNNNTPNRRREEQDNDNNNERDDANTRSTTTEIYDRRGTTYRTLSTVRTTTTTTQSSFYPGDYNQLATSQRPPLSSSDQRDSNKQSSINTESCGTVIAKTNPLIISGEETYHGQFPWHAALYVSIGAELKYICAGSLITKYAIVTAAHCVTFKDTTRSIDIDSLLVYLGKFNLRKWTGPEQDLKVAEIIINPKYDNERFYSDIAIVKFKTAARYSDYVRPICLWNYDDNELRKVINKLGNVPGWGYNEEGMISESLSYIKMPIVAHETCIWSDRDFFSRITSDVSFCAGFRNGSSVCNGDSGGGLVIQQNDRKWYLRGIVSVSIALQNHFLCDPNHYAVFTDAAKFVDWIKETL